MVERDEHDAALREIRPVEPGRAARAGHEAAAVDVHHHRALARVVDRAGEDVEDEAVLAARTRVAYPREMRRARGPLVLRRTRPVVERVPDARPAHRPRRKKTVRAA